MKDFGRVAKARGQNFFDVCKGRGANVNVSQRGAKNFGCVIKGGILLMLHQGGKGFLDSTDQI